MVNIFSHTKSNPIYFFLFLGLFFSFVISFAINSPVRAAYEDLSSSLPDDNYPLLLNGRTVNNTNDCYVSDLQHGDCVAGPSGSGGSHQYLTLSRGSINDDNRPLRTGYPGYRIELEIFTKSVGSKSLSISLVDRGIGDTRACRGYSIDAAYKYGDGSPISGYTDDVPMDGCNKNYAVRSFPSRGFQEIVSNGVPTGVFKGLVVFNLSATTPISKQASFHINTGGGARLGYKTASEIAASVVDGWVNTYPTNAADGHRVTFRFSPPCETPPNTPFSIEWDDVNEGGTYQPGNATVKVFRQHRDGSNRTEIVRRSPGSGPESIDSLRTANYAPNSPYVYSVEFENIRGGNGISFRYPYSSANFFLACPASVAAATGWTLDNFSAVNPGIGNYNPVAGDSTATRSNKARIAYQNADFYHAVQNLPSSAETANNGAHNSHIQYRLKRSSGSAWGNSQNNNTGNGSNDGWVAKTGSSSQSATLAPGRAFLVNDGGSTSASIPKAADLAYLLKTCSSHDNCSNTARNPTPGDTYCERVRTSPSTSTGGPIITSPPVCITLGVVGQSCLPWQVVGITGMREVDDSNNPTTGNLGTSVPDAWVGSRYGFYYLFGKTGHASQTGVINFYHNSGSPTHSQTLGSWISSSYVGIQPSDGGRTIVDQMAYEPTQGLANCSVIGNNTLANTITVPYYYHLKTSSGNVSDRTQQGDPVSPQLTVNLPSQDNQGDLSGEAASDNEFGGRQHTWSEPTNWRILEFRTSDINSAKSAIPKNRSGGSGDCPEIGSFGISGFSGCGIVTASSQVFTIGDATLSYTRPPQLDPVDTKICYVGVTGRPTHNASPAWRYSNVSCTTIIKSPKIQFLNGDLTVGRHRLSDGGTPCADPVSGAPIQANGASSGVSLIPPPHAPLNAYGSWVEYGAFASGNISGFGTAAYARTSANNEKKLMFGNTPTSGRYNYAAGCLSNPFDLVKEPDVTYIDTQASDLRLNEFFANPPYNNSASDKTGYVANNAAGNNPKDIVITQAGAPAAPLDDNFAAFKGRDIVIYAKKGAGSCNAANVGGNITITNDINYAKTGYGDVSELPRIILLADCKITINDNVKRVDAWLIAKDAVQTCSAATGIKFKDRTVTHLDCVDQLVINGPVQANRLLLWRTHGADLTTPQSAEAAEIFDLRPDQLLSTYARGRDAGKPHTVYQTDLPPLY